MEQIKISCDVQNFISYKEIKPFQGELKSLSRESYEKLKKSIIRHGIHMPIHVWENENILYTIDGHQRIRTFSQMEIEGYSIPNVPIVKINAPNIQEAKRILLTTASIYGKIEGQGLYEYALEAGLDLTQLHDFDFPSFNMDNFEFEFFKDTVDINEKELDENINTEKECPSCGYKW